MKHPLNVIQYPSGKWGFVGTVPAHLAYVTPEGGMPSDQQLRDAAQGGPRLAGLVTRTWDTKEAALASVTRFSTLTPQQEADLHSLESCFPFRICFAALHPDTGECQFWARCTRHKMNAMNRAGWLIFLKS